MDHHIVFVEPSYCSIAPISAVPRYGESWYGYETDRLSQPRADRNVPEWDEVFHIAKRMRNDAIFGARASGSAEHHVRTPVDGTL